MGLSELLNNIKSRSEMAALDLNLKMVTLCKRDRFILASGMKKKTAKRVMVSKSGQTAPSLRAFGSKTRR